MFIFVDKSQMVVRYKKNLLTYKTFPSVVRNSLKFYQQIYVLDMICRFGISKYPQVCRNIWSINIAKCEFLVAKTLEFLFYYKIVPGINKDFNKKNFKIVLFDIIFVYNVFVAR